MTVHNLLEHMSRVESDNFIKIVDCNRNPIFSYEATPAKMLFHLPDFLSNKFVLGVYSPYVKELDGIKYIIREIMISINGE